LNFLLRQLSNQSCCKLCSLLNPEGRVEVERLAGTDSACVCRAEFSSPWGGVEGAKFMKRRRLYRRSCRISIIEAVKHLLWCWLQAFTRRGIMVPHARPLPRNQVCLPPWAQREEQQSIAGEGMGVGRPISDDRIESLALCILCACNIR
jgi:hypothetical protein